jgi:hypothetical protein
MSRLLSTVPTTFYRFLGLGSKPSTKATTEKFVKQAVSKARTTLPKETFERRNTKPAAKGWSWQSKALMGAGGAVVLLGGRMFLKNAGYNVLHIPYVDDALEKGVTAGLPYAKSLSRQTVSYLSSASQQISTTWSKGLEKLSALNPFRLDKQALNLLDCSGDFAKQVGKMNKEGFISSTCENMQDALSKVGFDMTPERVSLLAKGDATELNNIYRQFKLTSHPDKTGIKDANSIFAKMNTAFSDFISIIRPDKLERNFGKTFEQKFRPNRVWTEWHNSLIKKRDGLENLIDQQQKGRLTKYMSKVSKWIPSWNLEAQRDELSSQLKRVEQQLEGQKDKSFKIALDPVLNYAKQARKSLQFDSQYKQCIADKLARRSYIDRFLRWTLNWNEKPDSGCIRRYL